MFSTRQAKCWQIKINRLIYPSWLLQEIYSSTNAWNPEGNACTQKASDLAIVEALLLAAPLTLSLGSKEVGAPNQSSLLLPPKQRPTTSLPKKHKGQMWKRENKKYKALILQDRTLQIINNQLQIHLFLSSSLEPLETIRSES